MLFESLFFLSATHFNMEETKDSDWDEGIKRYLEKQHIHY